jgi:hypothetical protein
VTLAELEATLPNGLHDSSLRSIMLDYVNGVALFTVDLWVGTMDLPAGPERERQRRASLEFAGLLYCSIDPPDFRPHYRAAMEPGPAWLMESDPVDPPSPLPEGAFEARMFVNDWNSFIQIAAVDVSLTWID